MSKLFQIIFTIIYLDIIKINLYVISRILKKNPSGGHLTDKNLIYLKLFTVDFLHYHLIVRVHGPVFVANLVYYGTAVDVYNFNNQRTAERSTSFQLPWQRTYCMFRNPHYSTNSPPPCCWLAAIAMVSAVEAILMPEISDLYPLTSSLSISDWSSLNIT